MNNRVQQRFDRSIREAMAVKIPTKPRKTAVDPAKVVKKIDDEALALRSGVSGGDGTEWQWKAADCLAKVAAEIRKE